jgi:hypothetical protein
VSIAWTPEGEAPRLDVLVLSSSERSIYGTNLQGDSDSDADWTADWAQFGGRAASPPSVCGVHAARIDIWVRDRDTNNVTHNWWLDDIDDPAFFALGDADWQTQGPGLGPVTSAPSVVCRASNDMHDVVYYDGDARPPVMRHERFHEDQQLWAEPGEFEAGTADQDLAFVGEPRAFTWAEDTEHLDIFGVRASADDDDDDNYSLFHVAYSTTDDRYTDLRGLGGNITSVPTAVSLAEGTIDAIALGRNGRLKRIHYGGDNWADDWEDLGIETRSAPLAVNVDGVVTIFAVGESGALTVATADNLADADSWADQLSVETWDDAGLSLEFFVRED